MIRIPGPRAHLAGTLRVFDALAAAAPHPRAAALRAWLDRPSALPAQVPAEDRTLKYDMYFTQSPVGTAWGLAASDRYEGDRWPIDALAAEMGGHPLGPARRLRARLRAPTPPAPMWAAAVGFGSPSAPPRLKLYLQEERWGAGLGPLPEVRAALAEELGVELPEWVRDAPGVITVEPRIGAPALAKLYLGGAAARDPGPGAPAEVADLTRALDAACARPGGWTYLTVRLDPEGRPPRVALNHIYNHVQVGFKDGGAGLAPAWAEVRQLFAGAGHAAALDALRARVEAPGLRVVPSAVAVEDGGRSVDAYFAAWALPPGPAW